MTSGALALQYKERPAPESLQTHIASFWMFKVVSLGDRAYDHRPPPDGCVSLVVRFPEDESKPVRVALVGPRLSAFEVQITTLDTYYGIRFWPHAARSVLGASLGAANEFVGPANVFVPETAGAIMQALPRHHDATTVEQALIDAASTIVARAPAVDSLARQAVEQLVASHGTKPMSEIAGSLDISLRQLQRRFRASSGVTLKQFARLRRFRKAATALLAKSPRRWVDVAYDAGYADQAHLSREFSQLIGLTAEEMREKHGQMNHDGVEPYGA